MKVCSKSFYRTRCKQEWRRCLADKDTEEALLSHLAFYLQSLEKNTRLLIFLPLADELQYLHLLKGLPLECYAPYADREKQLSFLYFDVESYGASSLRPFKSSQESGIERDSIGIPSPSRSSMKLTMPLNEKDSILLPCLGVAKNGLRLGRGGGYYDRWMGVHSIENRVTVAPKSLANLDFPGEAHDLSVQKVIHEDGVQSY